MIQKFEVLSLATIRQASLGLITQCTCTCSGERAKATVVAYSELSKSKDMNYILMIITYDAPTSIVDRHKHSHRKSINVLHIPPRQDSLKISLKACLL